MADKRSPRQKSTATGIQLVPLEAGHIPAIIEIEKQSNSSPWSERSFVNELDHPYGVFLVAVADGRIVGFGGVWIMIDEAHVTTVAVSPDHRRRGIGKRIVSALLDAAQARGTTCATLEVRASNTAAIGLYEDLGFVRSAVRKRYYPDNREDAVVMWKHD
ncbi:MAG TPA: ribosomal protein S18-alanine N-acetyltransferase [Fimbriimonadaceae bacterium]|nr:ribosomal protein S18-alanine N-acetyltransferase [Fimbriimonadaceae bacterium]HRJ95886.1 ribosomal protein S18-alanine N-acetyltransferase [Fimbriimonadaceae bacterium]